MSLRVSVVIPTFRRPDLLERCLTALSRQSLAPADFEVIVADDAALGSTRTQVESWVRAGLPNIVYIPVQGNHGPAAARNQGWRKAGASLVAFTDDDTQPDPDWLLQGLEGMADPHLVAAAGQVIMPLPPVPTDYEKNESGLCTAEFVTANCFCRKSALEGVGGFDERFTLAWREDSDLHFSLMLWAEKQPGGLRVGKLCDAFVVHPVRPAPWGVSLKQQKKSMFNALLYKKFPELYKSRIQALPPLKYYATVACLLLWVASLIFEMPRAVIFFFWAWVMLTLTFVIRRLTGTTWRPSHVLEMLATSALIPPLAVYWRIRGGIRFKVFFL